MRVRLSIISTVIFTAAAIAQTRVRPDQIRNWAQVAPLTRQCTGTCLDIAQVAIPPDARDAWFGLLDGTAAAVNPYYPAAGRADDRKQAGDLFVVALTGDGPVLLRCRRPSGCIGAAFYVTRDAKLYITAYGPSMLPDSAVTWWVE